MNLRSPRWILALRRTPLHPQWLLPSRRDILGMVSSFASGVTLDVGCADRWVEKRLPPGCVYVGLDYPATGEQLYHAIPDCFGDALNLPVGTGTVDTVLLLDVIEHLPDPWRAMEEANRALKPGGAIILSVPFLYPVHDAPYDFQRFTTYGLQQALRRCGFEVTRSASYSRSLEVAGLIAVLAIAGAALQCWKQRSAALLLVLPALFLIPVINVVAWGAARVLPDWPAMFGGVNAVARKLV